MERFFSPQLSIPVLKASFPETILRKLLSPLQAKIVSHLDGQTTLAELSTRLEHSLDVIEHEIRKLIALDVVLICERSMSSVPCPKVPTPREMVFTAAPEGLNLHNPEHSFAGSSRSSSASAFSESCPVVVGKFVEDSADATTVPSFKESCPSFVPAPILSHVAMDALIELHEFDAHSTPWESSSLPMSMELHTDWTNPESCSSFQLPASSTPEHVNSDVSLHFVPQPIVSEGWSPPSQSSSVDATLSPAPTKSSSSTKSLHATGFLLMDNHESPQKEYTDEVNTFPTPPHREGMSQAPNKEPWHRRWLFMDAASRVTLPSAHTAKEHKFSPSQTDLSKK